ncbi:MAG: hypothetical protein U0350_14050 [Caldilineaceae bacterium]
MKRRYGTLGIGLALVWGLMLLMTGMPPVQAQPNPNAPVAPNTVYLPLIAGGAGTIRIKTHSGIHMGNRGIGTDWPVAAFQLITGTAQGIFPAATVVQSSQLFDFHRSTNTPCRIDQVKQVRTPALYNYLTQAIQQGTQVVIRVTPSPGNFVDYASPGTDHTLLSGNIPAGQASNQTYCNAANATLFRDIEDITQEMDAIYTLNRQYQWPPTHFYFEPANEPNNEWYSEKNITTALQLQGSVAWQQMDDYFSKLYDMAHAKNPNLQILTPPMGQHNFAEVISLGSCDPMIVDNTKWKSGYDYMLQTYDSTRFEGYSWHNYWNYGKEQLDLNLSVNYCDKYPKYSPTSHHLFQYFPDWLNSHIVKAKKPTFVTEADLNSRCQDSSNPVWSKVIQWEETKNSLHNFFKNETLANYVVAWLLVQEDDGQNSDCAAHDPNYEIYLHEAYFESNHQAFVNKWFNEWWLSDEEQP